MTDNDIPYPSDDPPDDPCGDMVCEYCDLNGTDQCPWDEEVA